MTTDHPLTLRFNRMAILALNRANASRGKRRARCIAQALAYAEAADEIATYDPTAEGLAMDPAAVAAVVGDQENPETRMDWEELGPFK